MPYTYMDFRSKKELKAAVEKDDVGIYQPGPFGPRVSGSRTVIEGPHYPKPLRWYADVEVRHTETSDYIPRGSKVK